MNMPDEYLWLLPPILLTIAVLYPFVRYVLSCGWRCKGVRSDAQDAAIIIVCIWVFALVTRWLP